MSPQMILDTRYPTSAELDKNTIKIHASSIEYQATSI